MSNFSMRGLTAPAAARIPRNARRSMISSLQCERRQSRLATSLNFTPIGSAGAHAPPQAHDNDLPGVLATICSGLGTPQQGGLGKGRYTLGVSFPIVRRLHLSATSF
jgi:hypothetical protein